MQHPRIKLPLPTKNRFKELQEAASRAFEQSQHDLRQHGAAWKLESDKAIESAASTDDEDLEAADLGDLEPKLADPVAEQNRLLNERPIYADDPPMVGAKLIDLSVAAQEPVAAVAVGSEPSGAHAFQPLTFADPPSDIGNDSFSASVALALAKEEENAI